MNFLNNLTLRLQVAVLSTLFLFIIIVLGVLNIMDSNKSIESAKMTNEGVILPAFDALEARTQISLVRLSMMVNYYVPERRQQALQQEKEARAHFEKHWAAYRKSLEILSSQQEGALADKVDQLKVEYFQHVDAVLKLPYDDENYLNAMKAGAAVGAKLMQTLTDLNDFLLETSLPAQIAADQARAENNVSLTITLLIASVVLGIIGTLIVASVMAKNINVAVDFAELVANKRLDTSVQVGNKHTEVGKLTNALSNMQHSMRSVLGNISRGSQELNAAAAQLASSAEKILDSSHQQSESASSAAASVEELTVSIDQVNSQATSTRHAAEQARQESQLSSKVIRQASEQVQSIAQTMQQSVHLAEDLGARSQEINAIVNTIRDIADQTNLLALNAAIEAARAGEQGRGFAVVADEVRKLAERTASSTEEIGAVVDNIRNGIQTMVDDMKNSESQVTEGVAMAQQAKDAIDTITKSSENILSLIASIADALNEQSSASQQVAKSVEHIAQMAEENNRLVSDASQASSQLDQLANTLHRDVAQFKL